MEAIIAIIATIAPGVVSVLGILGMILGGALKLANIINQFRDDKDQLLNELRASDNEYKTQIMALIEQNKQLANSNKLLTDQIAKIKGYSDTMGV